MSFYENYITEIAILLSLTFFTVKLVYVSFDYFRFKITYANMFITCPGVQ